ncbi:hypothetical protein HY768_09555 [candidate division TA06 bacterium]|uniref:DUF4402 domain-containing protein n=1 Tax=candidate division TA06 bacterium TaxID=2250710 RepID=A0A933MIT0_UNCT6|nr:hypothetical protein [candidate division TA06 bacterium]
MKRLLIIAAVFMALPAMVWAQVDDAQNKTVQIAIAGTFTLSLSGGATVDLGTTTLNTTVNTEASPIIVTVLSNYAGSLWYLKIHDNQALTSGSYTIPNASYTHKSSGGAGVHLDLIYTAMTTSASLFYTCDLLTEDNNLPGGTAITCNLQVAVPNNQNAGTYSNTTTYTLTATN